ncbi:uncharacterized protein G2W53_036702 [Senna tora]|uniref:Uncharacterized protein n=1 Tax=Senna tora TaxID=362788 RepID=A0A834WAG4_9FABA|nr:uncharacterized protein G2W53_036702 [Senna tora]
MAAVGGSSKSRRGSVGFII